jgi:hypothetical protein
MVIKGQLKIISIILFSVVLHLSSFSQSRKYFIISGIIISETGLDENSSILISKNSQKSVSSPIPDHGRFRLELEYNAEYQLTFHKKGNLPKTILVNTAIPETVVCRPSNFPHFLMAVKLFKANRDAEILYSGNYIQQISYSAPQDCFTRIPTVFDAEYVDKGISASNYAIQSQENKAKSQAYQVF